MPLGYPVASHGVRRAGLLALGLAASVLAACGHVGGEAALNSDWEACRQEPTGDMAVAIAVCSSVLDAPNATNVDRARALNNRGVAYNQTGRPEEALRDFAQAIALNANDPHPFYNRSALHWGNGCLAEALADISRTVTLDGDNAQYVNARGLVYESQGDFDRALADFSQAIALDPGTAQWRNSRCWLRATHRRDLDAALTDCDAALAASPDEPYYLDSRGMVHLQRGAWRAAIADYDLALSRDARLAAAHYGRGLARLRLNDRAGGQADLEAARGLNPDIAQRFARYGLAP